MNDWINKRGNITEQSIDALIKIIIIFFCRRKHKKHKRQKRSRNMENGAMEEKLISNVMHKEIGMNGKTKTSILEVVSTEESEDEKLVDLDSDEVDCTIIEDDIDLEELMKQKVGKHVYD